MSRIYNLAQKGRIVKRAVKKSGHLSKDPYRKHRRNVLALTGKEAKA